MARKAKTAPTDEPPFDPPFVDPATVGAQKPRRGVKAAAEVPPAQTEADEAAWKPPAWAPKTLGACADMLYAIKAERAAAQKIIDEIETREKQLKEHLIQTLPKSEASGISGAVAKVAVVTKEVPQVKDWAKFYAYVAKTKQFELLQKRLSDGAIKERWEAGKAIPGVESFRATTISLTKV